VLAVIGAAIGVAYFHQRVDEEIRTRVEARIARHYSGLKVTVHSAELVEGVGIEVRRLAILEPGADGPRAELINLEEVVLACRTDLTEWINREPQITHVTIRRPTLRVTRRPDGTWSTAKLLPLPRIGEHPPDVTIEDGTIEIFDPQKNPSSTLTLRNVNLTFSSSDTSQKQETGPNGLILRGMLAGDHFHQVELEGTVDPRAEQWDVGGRIVGLDISPEFRHTLPEELAARLAVLGALRGKGDFVFRLRSSESPDAPLRFELSGELAQGRIDDPGLRHPLTEMRAKVHAANEGFAIDGLFARSGEATVRLSCRGLGYDEESPVTLEAEIRQLELDRRLLDILPGPLRNQWPKYLPAGRVHADVKLTYNGQTWKPELSVQCLDVSFAYHKLPYRLEHGRGTLELAGDILRVNLTAYSRSQPVHLTAEVHHPMCGPSGWLQAQSDNIELDEKLFTALPEKTRRVVHSLDPRGTVSCVTRIWRDRPDTQWRCHTVIGLNRCSMRYAKFPYPLSGIRGTVEILDKHWTFRNLEGSNDTGYVTCRGHLAPTPQGNELQLWLSGANVPLEEELRDALRPNMKRLWNDLRPRGVVDLDAKISYLAEQKKLNVAVQVRPQSETTSVEPVAFPYRLEKLQGTLDYRDGHVDFERLKAEHGHAALSTAGYCDFLPDGSWHFHLDGLSIDRLHLERELIQALPGRLRKALVELNPRGPVNLHGTWDLERSGDPGDPLRSKWDLAIGFHQGSVDCGVKLENMHGGLKLVGRFDGRHFHSRGELAIDSLTYRDMQFTQVMGPVWIDDRQVLFGSWVDRQRPLTARLFGGTVCGNGWVTLSTVPRYMLRATLSQADLARYAQEVTSGRQRLQGKIFADVELRGADRSINALAGHGKIRLRNADVYELPLMVALLKILSIRRPDTNAFSKSDIDFRIQGNHVYFDRIDFNGDAISLLGKGEMNFQSDIRLTFHPVVGRDEWRVPVLHDLLRGASRQVMLVHVGGTLRHPETSKEVFPTVNQAFEKLQADLQETTGSPALPLQARGWMPNVKGNRTNHR